MSNLTGKVALVTGGSRGIGAETARQLAAQGAHVAISYNANAGAAEKVTAEINSLGGKAQAFKADAADPQAAKALVESVVAAFGKLDILVNNAGVFIGDAPTGEESFAQNFDVNVRGVYATTRAAVPHLSDGGRVINLGSAVGVKSIPGVSAYSATKAAVASLTRTWALELASRQITVNTVAPGPIDTDMAPADVNLNPAADYLRGLNPMNRFGTAAEVAAAVVFFASPQSSFITGTHLGVDGGMLA